MKYVIGLILGMVCGSLLALLFVLFNPLTGSRPLASLDVSDNDKLILNYSAVASLSAD